MAISEERTPATNGLFSDFKNQLAWAVFVVSTFGILYSAYLASTGDGASVSKREVFNILVPLFSTWVGTILAFYFSKENFESATSSVRKMADKLTSEQMLQQLTVRQVMKARGAIKAIVIPAGKDDDAVALKDFRDVFDKGNSRAPVFWTGDVAKYVVHDGTLAKFVADKAMAQAGSVAETTKLSDMMTHKIGNEDFKSLIAKIAFVKIDASLADARNAMLAVRGAQDVFVTKTGKPDEAVEGWLTNSDFARDL